MYIKTITTDDEFDEVKNEWLTFERKVNNQNITSSYIWQRTWWKHFKDYEEGNLGHNKRLCILFLYNDENELRAIAPFCEVTRNVRGLKYKTIEFLAQQWGATYLDIITDKLTKQECNFIFDWLKRNRRYDLVELRSIPEFSPNFDLYKGNITVLSACPVVKIGDYGNWDNYIRKEYSKSLRQNLRTAKNRMKRENVDYQEEVLDGIGGADLTEIEQVSRSKLIDHKGCIYNDLRKESFLKDIYYSSELPSNIVKLILNDQLASYRINFLYDQSKYCFDASYDRNYRHYDLGTLLVDLNVRDSFEKNLSTHCMGAGVDFYKLKFTKNIIKIYTFLKRGNTLKGMPLYLLKRKSNQRVASKFEEELRENLERG